MGKLTSSQVTAQSLRYHVRQFLDHEVSLEIFEDWVAGVSWDMWNADADVRRMVGAIDLRLAEYSSGHLTPGDLRHELESLLVDGYQPTAMQMPVLTSNVLLAPTVSMTSPASANIQTLIVACDAMTSSQTCSGSHGERDLVRRWITS